MPRGTVTGGPLRRGRRGAGGEARRLPAAALLALAGLLGAAAGLAWIHGLRRPHAATVAAVRLLRGRAALQARGGQGGLEGGEEGGGGGGGGTEDGMDYWEAGEVVVTFGRHRGKLYRDVIEEDPSYCKWVVGNKDGPKGPLLEFADYLQRYESVLQDYLDDEASENVVTFGKHKGKTYQELLEQDPNHCRWVLDTAATGEAGGRLMELAEWLLANAPSGSPVFQSPAGSDDSIVGSEKYKGKTFQEVFEQDQEYCQWVASLSDDQNTNSDMRAFRAWLLQKLAESDAPGEGVLASGKHAGKLFGAVLDEDPNYAFWVVERARAGGTPSALDKFATWLQENWDTDLVMTVGKHKGMSYQRIVDEDPGYAQYVTKASQTSDSSAALQKFARWMEASNIVVLAEDVLDFGKHKGRTYEDVVREHPDYCRWALSLAADGERSNGLSRFQEYLKTREGDFESLQNESPDKFIYGEFAGKTFSEVFDSSPDRMTMLCAQASEANPPKISVRVVEWLRANKPDFVRGLTEDPSAPTAEEDRVAGEDLSKLTVVVLRKRCAELGLPTTGKKAELLERLAQATKGNE